MIYLAGPITAAVDRTVEDNIASAVAIYLRLIKAGIWAFCPHLCGLIPAAFDVPYKRWLEYDFFIITRSDAVLMLPNWEMSRGAVREHEFAALLGKKIFYSIEEVLHDAS